MKWNVCEQNVVHTILTWVWPRVNQAAMTSMPLIRLTWCLRQLFDEFQGSADGRPILYWNSVFFPLFILVNKTGRINDNESMFGGDPHNPVERPKVRNISLDGVFGEPSRAAQAAEQGEAKPQSRKFITG